MSKKAQTCYFNTKAEMAEKTAEIILAAAVNAIKKRGCFSLVLSGGNTPKPLFAKFAESSFSDQFPWNHTHIFWGDERCVSPDSEFSNFKTANDLFLSKVPISPKNIHRLKAENEPYSIAAEKYEKEIIDFFNEFNLQHFDFVLLGMGEDGHTASLFPGSPALAEKVKGVVPVEPPVTAEPHVPRITMTYHLLNKVEKTCFLISGEKKKNLIETFARMKKVSVQKFPVTGIVPDGTISWFICLN